MSLTSEFPDHLARIRRERPLIHNITNYVVMNSTANALLALGASPVMAHAHEEVEEMVSLSRALVVNIGTLDDSWIRSISLAMKAAHKLKRPIVFDPVGCGATNFRTKTSRALLNEFGSSVIRGNASEILALSGEPAKSKGVDSENAVSEAIDAAISLSKKYHSIVCVSGEVDHITDGHTTYRIFNGDSMMSRVTGMGCTASALIGAFIAIDEDLLRACTYAMGVMGICGELAAKKSFGSGSFQMTFIDHLFRLTAEDLRLLRYEV